MLMSSHEWSRRGYRIRTGARSFHRGAGGVPLFSSHQVTPWENSPRYTPPLYIQRNGYTYKLV